MRELEKYLEKYIISNMDKIGEEVKGVLRNFVLNDLYGNYSPAEYTRTEQFLNAVEVKATKKVDNSYQVEVFINPDKMISDSNTEGYGWLHHTSSLGKNRGDTEYQGKSIPEWIIYWFETGDNSSIFSRGKIGMIQKTKDWIKDDNYIKVRLQELFALKGIQCI